MFFSVELGQLYILIYVYSFGPSPGYLKGSIYMYIYMYMYMYIVYVTDRQYVGQLRGCMNQCNVTTALCRTYPPIHWWG